MSLKVVHASDWHGNRYAFASILEHELKAQPHIEEPDLFIASGDMVRNFHPGPMMGESEALLQRPHLEALYDEVERVWPGIEILGLRGNHDWCNYGDYRGIPSLDNPREPTTVRVAGEVITAFRGVTPHVGFWMDEFDERVMAGMCSLVPSDTTILITHVPPYGILDKVRDAVEMEGHHTPARHIGSHEVRRLVSDLPNLKAHCFGHVHEMGGNSLTIRGVRYSNAACTLNYFILE